MPSGPYKKLTMLNLGKKSGIIVRNQSKWAGNLGRVAEKIAAMSSSRPMFRPKVTHLFARTTVENLSYRYIFENENIRNI